MFPKVFEKSISRYANLTHCGVSFTTKKSKIQIINNIKKLGLLKFLEGDNPPNTNNNDYNYSRVGANGKKIYEDDRIVGNPTYHSSTQCCSWTKDSSRWFLFPLSDANFKCVGITIEDVLHYLKTLNDFRVGFNYLYLGLHAAGGRLSQIVAADEQHWFAVPAQPPAQINKNIPGTITYLHWIFLRMLINSCATGVGEGLPITLPYFNFPRVLMYLKDELKVNPWKAFLYAHAASSWYYYYSMTNAHSDINIPEQKVFVPDLSITKKDFKAVWYGGFTISINGTFCAINNGSIKTAGLNIKLAGKHDVRKSIPLWSEGKYSEFVEYMDSVYYPSLKKKADISKAKVITRGKKKATKSPAKRAAKANS